MVLAGLVRLEGVEYYFAWKTLKKSNTYVLFSKVHAQDLATYEIMNKHEFPIYNLQHNFLISQQKITLWKS